MLGDLATVSSLVSDPVITLLPFPMGVTSPPKVPNP